MFAIILFDLVFYQAFIILVAQEILEEEKENLNTLIFVHAIWRHGKRTPNILMEIDKNNNSTKTLGLGELTVKGFAQCYKLGQWVRKRYNKFLSDKYNPFELYIRSSDYNRTLMSAQAVAAPLYSLWEDELLGGINWRSIPIHTTSKSTDHLIFDSTECQKVINEEKRIFTSIKAKQVESENMEFLQFLCEKSGYNGNFLPFSEIRYVFDPLYCLLQNGETIPKWVNETVKQQIWSLYDFASSLLFSTELLVRLKAGRLFTDIFQRMVAVLDGKMDKRLKFYGFSAHDTTVAGILAAFGIRPQIFPRFSSLVLIELHKIQNHNWVRLLYKNNSNSDELWEWPIEGCSSPCSIQKLMNARREFILQEGDDECIEHQVAQGIYISLILLLSLLSASLAIYILLDHRQRKVHWRKFCGSQKDIFHFRFSKPGENDSSNDRLLSDFEEEIELDSI